MTVLCLTRRYLILMLMACFGMASVGCQISFPEQLLQDQPNNMIALFSLPQNRVLSVQADHTVRVVDVSSAQTIQQFSFQQGNPLTFNLRSIHLSEDGSTMITRILTKQSENANIETHITGWDMESGQKQFEWSFMYQEPALSADGSMMAILVPDTKLNSNVISIREVKSNQELFQISSEGQLAFLSNRAVYIHPGGEDPTNFPTIYDPERYRQENHRYLFISSFENRPDEIWDINTKIKIAEIPNRLASAAAISSDATRLLIYTLPPKGTNYVQSYISIWDLRNSKLLKELSIPGESTDRDNAGSFSADGSRVLTFGGNYDVGSRRFTTARYHIWDASSGELLQTITPEWDINSSNMIGFPRAAGFLPQRNDRIWISRVAGSIRLWDSETGSFLIRLGVQDSSDTEGELSLVPLSSPYFSNDGRDMIAIASIAGVNSIAIWGIDN